MVILVGGGGGGSLPAHGIVERQTPCEQNDKHERKHYLASYLRMRAVLKKNDEASLQGVGSEQYLSETQMKF